MSMGNPAVLAGHLGARASQEAHFRNSGMFPEGFETHSHGTEWEPVQLLCGKPVRWVDLDEIGVTVDFDELIKDPHTDYRRAIIQRCKEFQKAVKRAAFQVTSIAELYALAEKVNRFDEDLPRDVKPSWDYLEWVFAKAERRVRGLRRKTWQWTDRNRGRLVQILDENSRVWIEGPLSAFRPKFRFIIGEGFLKIPLEADTGGPIRIRGMGMADVREYVWR